MNLSRSSLRLFVARSGNALLFFAGITLFTRLLPPDEIGVFFLYLAIIGVCSIPADLGIRGALEKRLSEGRDSPRLLGSAIAFKLVMLAVASTGLLVAAPVINRYAGFDIAGYLLIGLVVHEAARFYVQAVRGELRVGVTAPIEISRRVVWIGVSTALITSGFGLTGLLIGQICGRCVEFAWAYWQCTIPIGRPSKESIRVLFSFSKYHTITATGGRVYQWIDILVIGFFLTTAEVSAYEVAWQVSLVVLLVSKSIGLSLFPQASRWSAEDSLSQIGTTVSAALGVVLFVSVPAIVGAALYGQAILRFVFGPAYTTAAIVLLVLMFEKLVQSVNDVIGVTVSAVDRPDLAAKATVGAVTVNLLLNPLLVVTVGIVGAAIATTVAKVVNTLLHAHYLRQFVSFELPTRLVGWYTVASIVMGGVLVSTKQIIPVTNIGTLVLHIALGFSVYFTVSLLIPDVRERVVEPGFRVLTS